MGRTVLIALWILGGSSCSALAGSAPYQDRELMPAERAVLEKHFGKRPGDDVLIERSAEFPEVLRIRGSTHNSDSASWAPVAMIVSGLWIDLGYSRLLTSRPAFWLPEEATREILQSRGWSTLDEAERKRLALRWIIDSLPLDCAIRTAADGGHAPTVDVDGEDVVVRMWLIVYLTNIAGRHPILEQAPRIFRFKPDGSITEQEPAPAGGGG